AWRALDGLGRALAAQQRWTEAIARFEAAEQLLAQAARGVPDPSALTSFFGTHDHSARGLREAYLASGRTEQAFQALRRAQRRHLLALARDQRVWERAMGADWQEAYAKVLQRRSELPELLRRASVAPDSEQAAAESDVVEHRALLEAAQGQLLALLGRDALAEDETLRAPRVGELIVAWLRSDHDVEVYAAFGAETRHVRYAEAPAKADYLEPLADWLALARDVSVLSFSEPQAMDVHALPFRGAPLVAHVPVAYSLDLPPRAAEQATTREVALLTADRGGNLVYAQRELAALERVLVARGWKVSVLDQLEGLQPEARHEHAAASTPPPAAARAGLFYFAGHGRADSTGSLRSALAFTDSELSVADILALRAPPARVVLSACEAARAPDLREAVGISIAQAFVMAGSDEVLAASRTVDDRAAELISAHVREALAHREPLEKVHQRIVLEGGKDLDAYAFRRIVR
ncbi:MAG TPA: CHAT domain-containing protein, partial [Polyangiales bacterium]|nr:CHAT domain-containing protein [Polyangiales bacterium]